MTRRSMLAIGVTALAIIAGGVWAGLAWANACPEATQPAAAVVSKTDDAIKPACCCVDPACPPGCTPECAAECLPTAKAKTFCPPCPFCP